MAYESGAKKLLTAQLALKGGVNVQTLSGTLTLDKFSSNIQVLDPGGAARTVVLPAEETNDGLPFWFFNAADAAELLTITNDAAATIIALRGGESALVACNGSAWATLNVPEDQPGASTAAAGTTTADAEVLPAATAAVYPTTAADDTKGVRIHDNDKVKGRSLMIGNGVSNKILKVYPPSGGTINGAAADAACSSASGRGLCVYCLSASGNTWLAW